MKRWMTDAGGVGSRGSFGLLLLRIATGGLMLWLHGWPKYENFDKVKETFPVPDLIGFLSKEASLWITIGMEVGAAALIVLGLFTRPAAFLLGATMAVAAFQVKAAAPLAEKELALMYLAPCLCLLFTGAGSHSLDRAFGRR